KYFELEDDQCLGIFRGCRCLLIYPKEPAISNYTLFSTLNLKKNKNKMSDKTTLETESKQKREEEEGKEKERILTGKGEKNGNEKVDDQSFWFDLNKAADSFLFREQIEQQSAIEEAMDNDEFGSYNL